MLRIAMLSIALLLASTSTALAQGVCNESVNPHSFACQEKAFENRSEFPLVETSLNDARGTWFATTFATPFGMAGDGFAMDLDRRNPRRPGAGVLNVPGRMLPATVMGNLRIDGVNAAFDNWQNQRLVSAPRTLRSVDEATFDFQAVDRWGISHNFQCRVFLRGEIEHLTCKWFVWSQGQRGPQWFVKGFFGFLRESDWDQFVQSRR